jgi:hypothetical protein
MPGDAMLILPGLALAGPEPDQAALERRCKWWSWFAIVCIVVGTVCQIVANWV